MGSGGDLVELVVYGGRSRLVEAIERGRDGGRDGGLLNVGAAARRGEGGDGGMSFFVRRSEEDLGGRSSSTAEA